MKGSLFLARKKELGSSLGAYQHEEKKEKKRKRKKKDEETFLTSKIEDVLSSKDVSLYCLVRRFRRREPGGFVRHNKPISTMQ